RLGPLRGRADDHAGLVADDATAEVVFLDRSWLLRRRLLRRLRLGLRRGRATHGDAATDVTRATRDRSRGHDLAARTGRAGLRRAAERTRAGLRRRARLARTRAGLDARTQRGADRTDRT